MINTAHNLFKNSLFGPTNKKVGHPWFTQLLKLCVLCECVCGCVRACGCVKIDTVQRLQNYDKRLHILSSNRFPSRQAFAFAVASSMAWNSHRFYPGPKFIL